MEVECQEVRSGLDRLRCDRLERSSRVSTILVALVIFHPCIMSNSNFLDVSDLVQRLGKYSEADRYRKR